MSDFDYEYDGIASACSGEVSFVLSDLNFEALQKLMAEVSPKPVPKEMFDGPVNFGTRVFDMPIISSPYVPSTAPMWVPPRDPFVEFEKKDEPWAKKLGFGKTEERRVYYGINSRFMIGSSS